MTFGGIARSDLRVLPVNIQKWPSALRIELVHDLLLFGIERVERLLVVILALFVGKPDKRARVRRVAQIPGGHQIEILQTLRMVLLAPSGEGSKLLKSADQRPAFSSAECSPLHPEEEDPHLRVGLRRYSPTDLGMPGKGSTGTIFAGGAHPVGAAARCQFAFRPLRRRAQAVDLRGARRGGRHRGARRAGSHRQRRHAENDRQRPT